MHATRSAHARIPVTQLRFRDVAEQMAHVLWHRCKDPGRLDKICARPIAELEVVHVLEHRKAAREELRAKTADTLLERRRRGTSHVRLAIVQARREHVRCKVLRDRLHLARIVGASNAPDDVRRGVAHVRAHRAGAAAHVVVQRPCGESSSFGESLGQQKSAPSEFRERETSTLPSAVAVGRLELRKKSRHDVRRQHERQPARDPSHTLGG